MVLGPFWPSSMTIGWAGGELMDPQSGRGERGGISQEQSIYLERGNKQTKQMTTSPSGLPRKGMLKIM